MDAKEDVKLYIKLPSWFTVDTPLGKYNPDWAIVKENSKNIYLVRETKSSDEKMDLRNEEWGKILCGKAHFSELGLDFKVVTSAEEI